MLTMLLITVMAIIGVVYVVIVVWSLIFATVVPSFVVGLAGGLAALPIWEGLKRIKRGRSEESDKSRK